jgi:hypothetical protein
MARVFITGSANGLRPMAGPYLLTAPISRPDGPVYLGSGMHQGA